MEHLGRYIDPVGAVWRELELVRVADVDVILSESVVLDENVLVVRV